MKLPGIRLLDLIYNKVAEEVKLMDKEKIEKTKEQEKEKKIYEKIPHCTSAPNAEHARADDNDDPCDDGRGGNINK